MNQFLIAIIGLITGIIATILISKYYFKRSLDKSITPYIQFSSSPLKGIDPSVRKELEVKYQNHAIESLYEIQFLIANTGTKAIRDVIEPLTLTIPKDCTLLDANILHVKPIGRKIHLEISEDKKEIRHVFPVLNSNEFFITKLLLNGTPKEKDFSFSIISDYLPPTLKPIRLPHDSLWSSTKKIFSFFPLSFGLIVIFFGLAIAMLIYDSLPSLPSWNKLGPLGFFTNLGLSGWAVFVCVVPLVALLLLGIISVAASFTGGHFPPPKKKFIVPNDEQLIKTSIKIEDIE